MPDTFSKVPALCDNLNSESAVLSFIPPAGRRQIFVIYCFISLYFILLVSVFWTLSIVIVFFFSKPLRFEGWLFPRPQVKATVLDPLDRASLYLWTDGG
jgi:hypothetical protein